MDRTVKIKVDNGLKSQKPLAKTSGFFVNKLQNSLHYLVIADFFT